MFAAFGRWRMGWAGRDQATLTFRSPGDVALTPSQRATAWFFFVMAALFLIQTLVGGMSQPYRAELDGFMASVKPPQRVRSTWKTSMRPTSISSRKLLRSLSSSPAAMRRLLAAESLA